MLFEAILLFITLLPLLAFLRGKHVYSYWERRDVLYTTPTFPFGNMCSFFTGKKPMYQDIGLVYNQLKGNKYGGFYLYMAPRIILLDPDVIKMVMSKDFHHFTDRGIYLNEKDDPLSANLISLTGERWKQTRGKLTPTFTSGKIKMMFQTLNDCATPFIEEITKLSDNKEPIDIRELNARYTTDIIGSCAFGVECNSLKDPDAIFRKYGKKAFEANVIDQIKMVIQITLPKVAEWFRMIQTKPEVSDFFLSVVKNTVKYRQENDYFRPDFMQLLINLMHSPDGLTLNEIAAQAYVFYLAGFETSSTTMTYCFYELAKNKEIQDKLRDEIEQVLRKHDDKITYESIKEMKYLEQVVDETLRMYPPVPVLVRLCTQEYQLPGTDLVIEKDMKVVIPVYALQHDPDFYPNPEVFDPDRFSEENKTKIVPYTYLPFGEGPRNCIGLRFGLMQTKIGVMTIVKHFRLKLNEKTPEPVTMNPRSFMLLNKDTIYLDAERIY